MLSAQAQETRPFEKYDPCRLLSWPSIRDASKFRLTHQTINAVRWQPRRRALVAEMTAQHGREVNLSGAAAAFQQTGEPERPLPTRFVPRKQRHARHRILTSTRARGSWRGRAQRRIGLKIFRPRMSLTDSQGSASPRRSALDPMWQKAASWESVLIHTVSRSRRHRSIRNERWSK